MRTYLVDLYCPICGKAHRVSNGFRLDDGPAEPGSLADLYGGAELPRTLTNLLNDLVWCEVTERWVNQKDWRRVYLTPNPPPPPLER